MKKALSCLGLEAIYFALCFGCMFLGFLSPVLWVYQPVLSAFLAATPVLILAKHWKKFGGVLALPAVYAIILIAIGEIRGGARIGTIIGVLLVAEAVRYFMGYGNQLGARISYAIASLTPACQLLLLWLDKDLYYAGAVEETGSVSYAEGLMRIATPWGLLALIVLTVAAGFLGAFVSEKIFKDKVLVEEALSQTKN